MGRLSSISSIKFKNSSGIDDVVKRHTVAQDKEDEEAGLPDQNKKKKKTPIVDRSWFNMLIGFFIALNAICIGLETDADGSNGGLWYVVEILFVLLFLAELLTRLYYHGLLFFVTIPVDTLQQVLEHLSWWNILDFIIVTMSILDAFILAPIGAGGANLRFMQMLRFARLLRLVRLLRLFKIFKELWLVANGLLESMKTLVWITLLLFFVCYIAGTYLTFVVGGNEEAYNDYFRVSGWDHEIYFGTLIRSVFTCFQIITMDNWTDGIARHVVAVQPNMVVFFLLIIMIGSFGLLNIIIGVVVENTLETTAKDQAQEKKRIERNRQFVLNHLRDIFEEADVDGSGTLTLEEVAEAVQKPHVYNKLKMIEFPVDRPDIIFQLLDHDRSGELSIDEFITGCVRMKGHAKSKDLLVAQVAMDTLKKHCDCYCEEMEALQGKVEDMHNTVDALTHQGEHTFLTSQEYRLRHPNYKLNVLRQLGEDELREAPWEEGLRGKPLKMLSPKSFTVESETSADREKDAVAKALRAQPPRPFHPTSADHLALEDDLENMVGERGSLRALPQPSPDGIRALPPPPPVPGQVGGR